MGKPQGAKKNNGQKQSTEKSPKNVAEQTVESSDTQTEADGADNSNDTPATVANVSTEPSQTICATCNRNLPGEWVVQCNDCERYFHYDCVLFDEATPEHVAWICPECSGKVLSSTAKENSQDTGPRPAESSSYQRKTLALQQEFMRQLNQMRSIKGNANDQVPADRDENQTSMDTVASNDNNRTERSSTNRHITVNGSSVNPTSNTRPKISTLHSIPNKSGSTSSKNKSMHPARSSVSATSVSRTSSQRRRLDIELQRLQDEYELQTKLDNEKLAWEKKAIELKGQREKKLMEAKYRALEEMGSTTSRSIVKTIISKGGSKEVNVNSTRSEMVESWIQEQRFRNGQDDTDRDIDPITVTNTLGVDLSIPVNAKELNALNERRSLYEEAESNVDDATFTVQRDEERQQLTSTTPAYNWNHNIPTSRTYDGRSKATAQDINSQRSNQDQFVRDSRNLGPSQNVQIDNPIPSQNGGISNGQPSNYNRISWNADSPGPRQQSTRLNPMTSQVYTNPAGDSQHNALVRNQSNGYSQLDRPTVLTPNQIAARHTIGQKDLPFFYGHPNKWPQFIQRYYNSTKLCGYTDCENIERLNKCLKGKAYEIVESLLVMPECIGEIIETLRDKFGRPELVAEATLAAIRAEPTIKSDKLEALCDFGYKVRNSCNAIESMGLHYHLYDPKLLQDVIKKLPYQTKIDWARYAQEIQSMNQQINLRTFAEWMHRLARTLNQITTLDLDTLGEPSKNKNDRKADNAKGGYVNVHEAKIVTTESQQPKCSSCSGSCKNAGMCSKFKSLSIDDKWKCVIDNNLCKRCLTKHYGKTCLDKKFTACGVNGCELKHNSLLHNEERHSKYKKDKSKDEKQKSNPSQGRNDSNGNQPNPSTGNPKPSNTHQVSEDNELFRVIPVNLRYNGISAKTFAFLDEGSSYTLMEKSTADKLNVQGENETICLMWTSGIHRKEDACKVDIQISGMKDSDATYPLRSVHVVEELGLSPQSVNPQALAERYKYLKGLPLPEYYDAIPTILIGLKHIRLTTPLETIEGAENEPIASRARLGWSVYGPTDGTQTLSYLNRHKVVKCPCNDRDENLHQIVKDHFSIENFGVSINSTDMESPENQKALEMLKTFTIRKGDRFETRLLWKNDAYVLPDSYEMARKRLTCVENKGPVIVNTINEIIEDYLAKGYATKLSPSEATEKHPRTFYLPIFTVNNPKKPGKIRPVFDAAATVRGVSLNSTLLTGPDLLSPLIDILRRFRKHRIAVVGDIREMFYRVWINEVDRHSQRFLWRNGEKSKEPDVYQFNVMTFGSKCSPSSAQFVKNKNASEYKVEYPRAATSIIDNHYVDDMLDGAGSVSDAIKLINEVKFVHGKAGFEIRNFKSNSKDVLLAIGEPIEPSKVELETDGTNVECVLGMFSETDSDCFKFSLKYTKIPKETLDGKTMPTKRQLLSLVMSLYDPLGLISYYTIHGKCLQQDVWRSKVLMGSNKQVRRAKIQFPNGNTLFRSSHNLGLLDINPTPTAEVVSNHPEDDKNRGEDVGAEISIENSNPLLSNAVRSVEPAEDQ